MKIIKDEVRSALAEAGISV